MAIKSEEAIMIEQEYDGALLYAYNKVPYSLINAEIEGAAKDTLDELTRICKYYRIYKKGADFTVEGSNGDYVPATLHYKVSASLVNKEARFLFAEPPTIQIEPKGNVGQVTEDAQDAITVLNDLVKTVLDTNNFEDSLLKAAKDCFIGKRVAGLVNFNEEDGVTITFLPSTQFIYDTKIGNPNVLTKIVCFIIVKDSITLSEKRIFKKKYTLEGEGVDKKVYLEETMHDGAGRLLEEITPKQEILLKRIPACVFINDGLSGELQGESEIELLQEYEQWYSKLNNADIDAERKSMNPVRYSIDMEPNSTKGLSSSAGSFWDLQSDQNLESPSASVGMLESSMAYSNSLKVTLDRIKTSGYEQVDVPNINLETMSGTITSGKALKAIYWPLIVRCSEKMKMWKPNLRAMIDIIIEGSMAYPNCITKYVDDIIVPVDYEVSIEQNVPLQEDEVEEKNMDLAEVAQGAMSRKSYMKKWRGLTDDEVAEELEQIALERQMTEDSFMMPTDTSDLGTQPQNAGEPLIGASEDDVQLDGTGDEPLVDEEVDDLEMPEDNFA